MTGRDLFFVVVGFVIGWAGGATYGAYNRDWAKAIKASFDRLTESLYARYRLPDGRTHHQIGWDRQKTQTPGRREYPPLHEGGAPGLDYYSFAQRWLEEKGLENTLDNRRKAFDASKAEYPGWVSLEPERAKKQWEVFNRAVRGRAKNDVNSGRRS